MYLFKTIHGSHLYGLAHESSDTDYYVVVSNQKKKRIRFAKQSIIDGIDTMTVDWGTWINQCQLGVPQALEAMFSHRPEFEASGIREFRSAFRCGSTMRATYRRTIDNFLEASDAKRKRHGLRLALNLRDGLRYGYFNPTLSSRQAIWVTYHANHRTEEELKELVEQVIDA